MSKNYHVSWTIAPGKAEAADDRGYYLSLDYLPYAVRRVLPLCLGSDYCFSFNLNTGKGTAGIEVEASLEIEHAPSLDGICTWHVKKVKELPEGERHPANFYAQQVVEVAERSVEFINSVMTHARDPNTSLDKVAKIAVSQAKAVREGLIPESHEPCVAQALQANVCDADLSYVLMRHAGIVGEIDMAASVRSFVNPFDPNVTLTTLVRIKG